MPLGIVQSMRNASSSPQMRVRIEARSSRLIVVRQHPSIPKSPVGHYGLGFLTHTDTSLPAIYARHSDLIHD